MAYVQTQGYGSRLVESIKGVLFGVVLFAISFPLLWWNEGRAVQTARSLEEGATSVVSVTGLVPSNEGKLVHFSGQATTAETLADHELGVTALALRMQRNVEMYQWYEKSESHENTGGSKTTVYTYDKKWSPSLIRSTDFKESGHDNPPQMPVRPLDQASSKAKLGDFDLSADIIERHVDKWQPIPVDQFVPSGSAGGPLNLPAAFRGKIRLEEGAFYLGADPGSPAIGDCRISYRAVKSPLTMSIIAKQAGSGFIAYPAKAGDALLLTSMADTDASTMFKSAEEENVMLTWILRGVGWFLMTLGIFLVLRPIAMVANFIPFAGSFVAFGAFILAAVGASGLSLVTVAVAWIAYRPVLGVAILLVAAVGIAATIVMMTRASAAKKRF
jgi:hypothetical protein